MNPSSPMSPMNPSTGFYNPASPYYYIYGPGAQTTSEVQAETKTDSVPVHISTGEQVIVASVVILVLVVIGMAIWIGVKNAG